MKQKIYAEIPTKENINEIEKTFNIEYIGNSRIDGYPYFKIGQGLFEVHNMREYFDIEYVPLLSNEISSLPAGEKDHLIFKVTKIKEDFHRLIRKEKLIKINLSV